MGVSILFKFADAVNPDPELDRGCYKEGDMVVVMPGTHVWGTGERPPVFFVVDVPDAGVEEVELYNQSLEAVRYVPNPTNPSEGYTENKMLRRKRMNFDINKLPKRYRDEIQSLGRTTIRWELLKACIRHRLS